MLVPWPARNLPLYNKLRKLCSLCYVKPLQKKPSILQEALNGVAHLAVEVADVISQTKMFKPDVIITNGFVSSFLVVVLRKFGLINKIPIIRDWKDLIFKMISVDTGKIRSFCFSLLNVLDWRLSYSFDGLIVTSNYVRKWIVSGRKLSLNKVFVIYEVTPLNITTQRGISSKGRARIALMSGVIRHYHIRALKNVIRAISYCANKGLSIELLVAGEFEAHKDKVTIIRFAKENHARIRLFGRYTKSQLNEIMSQSDVGLCMLPDYDFTRFITTVKLSEYLSHGLPVICSDLPSLHEICDGAGLYAKVDDVDSIVKALFKLFENYTYFREAAKKRATQLFAKESLDHLARSFYEWLSELVKNKAIHL